MAALLRVNPVEESIELPLKVNDSLKVPVSMSVKLMNQLGVFVDDLVRISLGNKQLTLPLQATDDSNEEFIKISCIEALNLGLESATTTRVQVLPVVAEISKATRVSVRIWGMTLDIITNQKFPLSYIQCGTLKAVRVEKEVCLVQVVSINDSEQSDLCYQVASDTIFSVAVEYDKPELPLFPATRHTRASVSLPSVPLAPTTSASTLLTKRWMHLRRRCSEPMQALWHIHGCETDCQIAVEAAADAIGYPLLVKRGLALQGYLETGIIRNGGLADQLLGLDAIIKSTVRPCVLLLLAFNEELECAADPEDAERRILSLLSQELHERLLHETPSLFVVLASEAPFESSHILRKIIYPSVDANGEDMSDDYKTYVWRDFANDEKEAVPDVSMSVLKDRTSEEIIHFRQRLLYEVKLGGCPDTVIARLVEEDAKSIRSAQRPGNIQEVRWEDIGGLDKVRQQLMDAIELPRRFPEYVQYTGILLYGPPGTGKTMVAKAVATECAMPFLSVKGPELLGSYVGESEGSVREIFSKARDLATDRKKKRGCILFFDELDSLAPKRSAESGSGGNNVLDRVVSTLLSELDRSSRAGVLMLGATNRPDLLDQALLRRFDNLVYLGIGDKKSILRAQLRSLQLEPGTDISSVANKLSDILPDNLTGADLSAVVAGAQMSALERLCQEAEEELDQNELVNDMDTLLDQWDETKLTPTVFWDDLLEGASQVVPSVSDAEMARYKLLRKEFSR